MSLAIMERIGSGDGSTATTFEALYASPTETIVMGVVVLMIAFGIPIVTRFVVCRIFGIGEK